LFSAINPLGDAGTPDAIEPGIVAMIATRRRRSWEMGTRYYFRFQAQTRKGLQDWSTVVSFVVL
jgi:hypothetical protein